MDDLTKNATIESTRSRVRRQRPQRTAHIAVLIIALLGAGAAAYQWRASQVIISTDDAFIDGRAVILAPQVSGAIVSLAVNDNDSVKAGDAILQIDPRPYEAARDRAAAELRNAEADLENARSRRGQIAIEAPARLASLKAEVSASQAALVKALADWRRQSQMPRAATTQQDIDAANAARLSAEAKLSAAQAAAQGADTVAEQLAQADARIGELSAKVALARAQLQTAELDLSWTRVTAPSDGTITKRNVEVGDFVQPGQALLSLVLPARWVTANFKESDLDRLRPGMEADISVDAYPGLKLKAHVDSIQMGTGSRFTAFPPENATGNFVKIVQRVPVKLVIDGGMESKAPLPLGASVTPVIHVR